MLCTPFYQKDVTVLKQSLGKAFAEYATMPIPEVRNHFYALLVDRYDIN